MPEANEDELILEFLAPLRALATLLPEAAGIQSHHARILSTKLSPAELKAVQAFAKAGQQCIGALTRGTIEGLKRIVSVARQASKTPMTSKEPSTSTSSSLTELFEQYDRDGDGVLSKAEFSTACKALLGESMDDEQISKLMKYSDVNGSGDIDIHEFVVWLYGDPSYGDGSGQRDTAVLPVGKRVKIDGLKGAKDLNGKTGVICGIGTTAGRYTVEVDGGGGQKSLKLQNLSIVDGPPEDGTSRTASKSKSTELPKISPDRERRRAKTEAEVESLSRVGRFHIGDRVRCGGLNGAKELNGQLAVVFGLDMESGRYVAEFENGAGQRKLRDENLKAEGCATGPIAAKARMMAGL
jgi:hypothetical protein